MKKQKIISLKQKLGIIVGLGIFITSLILTTYSTIETRKRSIKSTQANAEALAKDFMGEILTELQSALYASQAIADGLSSAGDTRSKFKLSREDAMKMGEKVLLSNKNFLGFSLAFEPNAFDGSDKQFVNAPAHDATGRFMVYLTKKTDHTAARDVLLDYTDSVKAPWYWVPTSHKCNFLSEPLVYPVQGKNVLLVSVMTPILYKDRALGTTGVDYAIDFIQDKVKKAHLFDSIAQLSILTYDGTFVANSAHPDWVGKNLAGYSKNVKEEIDNIRKETASSYTENDTLFIDLPFKLTTTNRAWQIRMNLPMKVVTSDANKQMWFQILLGLILIVVSVLVVYFFVQRIIRPIGGMVKKADAAADGNLVYSIRIDQSNDEIGLLSGSLETMIEKIKSIVSNVVISSENFVASSRELSVSAQQIANGANEQAASSEEISSSIEEMLSSISQTSDNALQTEKIAILATESIKKANESVIRTIEAMRTIIQKISIIKEIAEKTDLLAVNAAIESARAGEYGKGFAVVASEVRKLAEHSQKAAKEIDEISISSVATAEHSGQMLAEVIPQIRNTAKLVQEISATSLEQNTGITQINQAIQQLSMVVQSNSALSEELASSSEEVSSQALLLLDTISFFKITQKDIDVQSDFELEQEITKLTELLIQRKKIHGTTSNSSVKNDPRKPLEKVTDEQIFTEEQPKKNVRINIEDENPDNSFDKY
jgi:methyl-accepting chemotaxis protein